MSPYNTVNNCKQSQGSLMVKNRVVSNPKNSISSKSNNKTTTTIPQDDKKL